MKKLFKATIDWLAGHWREIISVLIVSVIAVTSLSLELSTIVNGYNKYESITLKNLERAPEPFHRSVNLPYFIPSYYVGRVLDNPLQGARVISVVLGLLATVCLFFILKMWFNKRFAAIGSLMFVTSSWLLNITHQATPYSLLILAPFLILAPLAWFLSTKKHKTIAFLLLAVGLGVASYIPLMPWIALVVIITLIVKGKEKLTAIKTWQLIIAAIIYLIILTPLFASLSVHPGQIREFIGLPMQLPTIMQYFKNLIDSMSSIILFSGVLPELHLGHLPMLDFFSATMMILGIIYFAKKIKTRRAIILFACMTILLLIIPLSPEHQMLLAVLLGFIYTLVVAGIVYLLNIWFGYFPRNPWARFAGIMLVVALIGMSCFYHLNRYFVAWPNTPATKSVYMIKSK